MIRNWSPALFAAVAGLTACASRQHSPTTEPAPNVLTWPADLVLTDSLEPKPVKHVFPTYPPRYQTEGTEAVLVAVYVVDTTGRADLGSVRFLLDAPHPFATAICDALKRMRFEPVRRDGQLRPALAIAPYGFFVTRDDESAGPGWPRDRPDLAAVRESIRQTGLPAAREQLASRPGCG